MLYGCENINKLGERYAIMFAGITYPVTLHVLGQPVLLHGFCEFLGIFIAFRYYLYLKRKRGDNIDSTNRLWVIVGACIGAFLGARLVGSLENLPEWIHSPHPFLYFNTNKTLVGGLLGGLFGVELTKALIKEKTNTGDIFTYPLILGMIIGRIGCFSAGVQEETYGLPTSLPWGMDLGDGIYRHPVTLYEILFLMLLWAGLKLLERNYVLTNGSLFKIFLMSYLIFRLLLDFIKPGWRYFFGLGTIQLCCIGGLLYYFKYLISPKKLFISKRIYAG